MKNLRIKCSISTSAVVALQKFADDQKLPLATALTKAINTVCSLQGHLKEGGKLFLLKDNGEMLPVSVDFGSASEESPG